MEHIIINTPGSRSEILVGESWEAVSGLIPSSGTVIITDNNVKALYGDKFPKFPVFSITPGESSKKLPVIEDLVNRLLGEGIDRSGFILAIGGGVVSDVAGFLAAVYMRGIACGYVASTLLAQVDASTGGKNGVNAGGTKNVIGTIRQPGFVICDPSMLMTLPEDEYLSGLAELIKTAIIGDKQLFELIEVSYEKILARDKELLTSLIAKSVRFKGSVVSEDEREAGMRRILNFGHTFGHAIELQKSVKHGFAVATGMVLATEFSFEKNYISRAEKLRITGLLNRFQLAEKVDLTDDEMRKLVIHDKKKAGKDIHFVFSNGIGKASVGKIPVDEVLEFYKRFKDKNS